jgi:predicted transcriptional regulator
MIMKTTIRLPSDLFARLKEAAMRNRRSITAQLVVLLEAALAAEECAR